MADVALENVTRRHPDGTVAVRDLSLVVEDGEFVVLVGPSGSGKTTVLRMVAGLDPVSTGVIRIGDRVVNDLAPRDRDVAMVFQNYALYPHMTVFENLAFALRLRKISAEEIRRRVEAAATLLGIGDLLHRAPRQLSGGQRQRVAMGRAIVRAPAVFLMDEPLSNLDAQLRVQTRVQLATLQQRLRTTTVYVTHDQTEAMTMGHRVAVLRGGVLQQLDTPQGLYERPRNLFVGQFIGSPAMNIIPARLEPAAGDAVAASIAGQLLAIPAVTLEAHPRLATYRELLLGIRPEDVDDAGLASFPVTDHLSVDVMAVELIGAEVVVHCAWPDGSGLAGDRQGGAALIGRVHPRTAIRRGDRMTIAVNTHRLYFFDPATEEAVGWPRMQ